MDTSSTSGLLSLIQPFSFACVMSSRPSPQYSDPSQRSEHRPTLPPIRDLFRGKRNRIKALSCPRLIDMFKDELAKSVPSSSRDPRHPSASPHIPFNRLVLSDEVPRYGSHSPAAQSNMTTSTSRSHRGHPHDPRSMIHAIHSRTASDSAGDPERRSGSYYAVHGHGSTNQVQTSGPPGHHYGSQPPITRHPSLPVPGSSSGAIHPSQDVNLFQERTSASHKYECSYCGKGFTRPSSLKVRDLSRG